MKINPAPFHMAQAVITGIVVALSICILGTSAHTLDVYNKQHLSNPWWAPMWPQHFDVQGTKALIASSVVTLVLCGAFLIASFVPQVSFTSYGLAQWSCRLTNFSWPFVRNTHSVLFFLWRHSSPPSFLLSSPPSGHTCSTAMPPRSTLSKPGRARCRARSLLTKTYLMTSLCRPAWATPTSRRFVNRASLLSGERL